MVIGDAPGDDVSATPASLTFSPENWNQAQTVTVNATGDDDAVADAAVAITHTVRSVAVEYGSVTADSVTVTITEDDTPGVNISRAALNIDEGGSESYTVVLSTQPSEDVTVTIGGTSDDVSTIKTGLTFTASDWSTGRRR